MMSQGEDEQFGTLYRGTSSVASVSERLHALVRATAAHGALPRRAPSTRCTAESMHHVWHRRRASARLVVHGGVSSSQALIGDTWAMSRQCAGRIVLAAERATFVSGDGAYANDASCSWYIEPVEPNRQATV